MIRPLCAAGLAAAILLTQTTLQSQAGKPAPGPAAPVVVLETAKGIVEIETFPEDSPKSVAHFVELARKGFYRGQRFHWVQAGSIVQTGDPLSRDLTKMREWGTGGSGYKGAPKPVGVAEPAKKKFERGIVGLAYQTNRKPETADSQFFILLSPNPALNGKYAALGKVIKGMDVLAKIEMQDLIKNVSVR
ncbi:MAG: peptidylprolyl isomerase [Acidobacteria bacterium]|nr:peptidylprolyl isomerase [Acidobacteriota bacterium]MBP8272866.1 peptidylprolyl isomerase [Acidobacteriota bacterium]